MKGEAVSRHQKMSHLIEAGKLFLQTEAIFIEKKRWNLFLAGYMDLFFNFSLSFFKETADFCLLPQRIFLVCFFHQILIIDIDWLCQLYNFAVD